MASKDKDCPHSTWDDQCSLVWKDASHHRGEGLEVDSDVGSEHDLLIPSG